MPSTTTLTAGSFLLALMTSAPVSAIAGKPPSTDTATIIGTVLDDTGQAAPGATVFVYSADLKQGYALVCPTCWIDCGKRADTDRDGHFTIPDLNPNLKFRLLVVKDGFNAATRGNVDPAQGALQPIDLKARAPSPNDSKIVHGRVIDPTGRPVIGALIQPVGVVLPGNGGYIFGAVNWLDPLAATNTSGDFAIVATQPVESVMLKIEPRGLAPKIVSERPGPAINSVVLNEGATIIGRLVEQDGTPIAHAEVVMISHDHENSQEFSDIRVGTGNDGSFDFSNVPRGYIWGIYPTLESLKGRNLTAGPYWIETTADRQVINVGKLTLRPGFTARGRLLLPDNTPIPRGGHANIRPDWTVDNRLAEIGSDGTFEFKSLSPGIYHLHATIVGYQESQDSPPELLINRDRRNIVIHMITSK
jgi:Carboxypeptidase regulatory-like domain